MAVWVGDTFPNSVRTSFLLVSSRRCLLRIRLTPSQGRTELRLRLEVSAVGARVGHVVTGT
eukprot:CAMPEP_0204330346 /NCGR_PEP_ID=MMETSP0469-20131031/14852_1 /ASSEMBLY_ACC=CAM_ASM_000384 /TAXON_ID=2969 /ORGANISM="Oxyrrhis marina" /LENGTH=60 /DNA_ID=CAMNT_0051313123 /DNA_START=138 /DNA_END=317 /DNA_ORIENTATION=-